MGTQGTHENSIEEMVKWTLGHSKCERPATGGYHFGISGFSVCFIFERQVLLSLYAIPVLVEIHINISQCT